MASSKIIVLSDGTGNAASSVWRTNVWRMFQALDLQGNTQAAKYDDGVGTSSFIPLAVLGGVFGYGLKRNVLDAYKFICRNYDHQNHSKIYLFGFSRGAFTARVLAALILEQGLVMSERGPQVYKDTIKTDRSGEIFLYVNEAVIALPWLHDHFYRKHQGTAKGPLLLRSIRCRAVNAENATLAGRRGALTQAPQRVAFQA